MPRVDFGNIIPSCNAEVFFWHIGESCEQLSELIADNGLLLAESERMFKSLSRQREWLAVRALLKSTPYYNANILYHSCGKPYLSGNGKHISISHTQEYVVIAVSDSPIGIDVEHTGRNAIGAVKAYLQPYEMDMLNLGDNPAEEALFLWSAKEAVFKLLSPSVTVLKEIGIAKNANLYTVVCPDNSKAICRSYVLGDLVISVASFIDI